MLTDCESEDSHQGSTLHTPHQNMRITRKRSKFLQSTANGNLDCHLLTELTGVNGESTRKDDNVPLAQPKTLNTNVARNMKDRKRTKNISRHQPPQKRLRKNKQINLALHMNTCIDSSLDQSDQSGHEHGHKRKTFSRMHRGTRKGSKNQPCASTHCSPKTHIKGDDVCDKGLNSRQFGFASEGKESSTLLQSVDAESCSNHSIQCISSKLSVKMKTKNQNSACVTDSNNLTSKSNMSVNLTEVSCQNTSTNQTQMESMEESSSDSESEEWEEVEGRYHFYT